MTKSSRYKESGVDIDAQEEALGKVRSIVRGTFSPDVVSDVGSFGGLFRASFDDLENPILVSSADGVGTKLAVAREMGVHDTIGVDLVNHCVNDILVQGARPLFFMDYFATGKLEPDVMVDVVRGVAQGCRENRLSLIGGETAEMPGFYKPGDYDIAGFIVGVVDQKHLLDGSRVAEGDLIIGLPSDGLHTNGYSLARKIVADAGLDYQSLVEELNVKIGESLLRNHKSYLRPLLALVENDRINAMAHITGGGLTDNLPRVIPDKLSARIKLGSWEVDPLFVWLVRTGEVSGEEALRVFNMGIGMVLIVSPDGVGEVSRHLDQMGQPFFFIGNVISGKGEVDYDLPPAGWASWIE